MARKIRLGGCSAEKKRFRRSADGEVMVATDDIIDATAVITLACRCILNMDTALSAGPAIRESIRESERYHCSALGSSAQRLAELVSESHCKSLAWHLATQSDLFLLNCAAGVTIWSIAARIRSGKTYFGPMLKNNPYIVPTIDNSWSRSSDGETKYSDGHGHFFG
jgi:hypothetical protein